MIYLFRKLLDMVKNETVKKGLVVTGKIGKAIVIEGIKGVMVKGATSVIQTSFDSGLKGVKALTVDEFVKGKKHNQVNVVPEWLERSEKRQERVSVDADFEIVNKNEDDNKADQ